VHILSARGTRRSRLKHKCRTQAQAQKMTFRRGQEKKCTAHLMDGVDIVPACIGLAQALCGKDPVGEEPCCSQLHEYLWQGAELLQWLSLLILLCSWSLKWCVQCGPMADLVVSCGGARYGKVLCPDGEFPTRVFSGTGQDTKLPNPPILSILWPSGHLRGSILRP